MTKLTRLAISLAIVAGCTLLPAAANAASSCEGEVAPDVKLVLRHKIDVARECTLLGRCAEHPLQADQIRREWNDDGQLLLFKHIERRASSDWLLGGLRLLPGGEFVLTQGMQVVLEYDDREVRSEAILLTDREPIAPFVSRQTEVFDVTERAIVVKPGRYMSSRSGAVLVYLEFPPGALPRPGWFNTWGYGKPRNVRLEGGEADVRLAEQVP